MSEPLTRREFTLQWALSVLGGAVITITGCGDSSTGPSAPTPATTTTPPAPSGDVQGTISANHGHTATITAAELAAGAAVTLGIRGTADHTHSVTVTAAEISQVAAGQRVSKESTNNQSHTHFVTFN
jgi:hypothetical protein